MRIVAKFFSEVVEVSGKTQLVENIKTNSKYWREQIIGDLQYPSALDEWYTPEPNTAHAFLAMLKERKEYYLSHGSGQNHVELLEMEDVAPMPYDEPFTGEPGDHVRVVALVDGQRVEVSGATQQMAMLKAESPLYEQIRIGMLFPPPLRATYGPDTDSALAFLSVLNEWQLFGKHSVEILVVQNIAAIPSEPGVVY
jgi:hypothetical protein